MVLLGTISFSFSKILFCNMSFSEYVFILLFVFTGRFITTCNHIYTQTGTLVGLRQLAVRSILNQALLKV